MKPIVFLAVFSVTASVFAATPDIKHLSPIMTPSAIPAECRIASILKDSPADKAGLMIGDVLETINGQKPKDASGLSELVSQAPVDSDFTVVKGTGVGQPLRIHLNTARPRLGAVCDLAGWVKPGVTAAGNESITIFNGPYAFTASGIIDKKIMFLRVRVTNDSDQPLDVGPFLFSAMDANSVAMPILAPKDVMCKLYGEKGAHMLALKKVHKETLDGQGTNAEDEHCPMSEQGLLRSADEAYAEANAQYLATESLWPTTYKPGDVADGLIYMAEPGILPITLTATITGRSMVVQLGSPQPSTKQMKASELRQFFDAQKKGASLRLTLKKGKVFVGRFLSYDPDNERAWFNAPNGLLNTISFSIDVIRFAEPLEQVPAKPVPNSDHLN